MGSRPGKFLLPVQDRGALIIVAVAVVLGVGSRVGVFLADFKTLELALADMISSVLGVLGTGVVLPSTRWAVGVILAGVFRRRRETFVCFILVDGCCR